MKTLFCMILAVVAVALAGCETESSDNISISISPNNVSLKKGESQTFTASGWRDYTWAFEDSSGVLSNTKGDTTTLTVIKRNDSTNTPLVRTLTVMVDIPADDVANPANISNNLVSAQAFVTIEYTP